MIRRRSWLLILLWHPLLVASQVPSPITPGQAVPIGTGSTASATPNAANVPASPPVLPASCKGMLALGTSDAASAPRIELPASAALALRRELTINVTNAKQLVSCLADSRTEPILFIDHVPLPDLRTTAKLQNATSLQLVYRLERTLGSTRHWDELLLRDWLFGKRSRPLTVGLGISPLFELAFAPRESAGRLADDQALRPPSSAFAASDLGRGNRWWGWGALTTSVVVFLLLSHLSKLIRDRAPKKAELRSESDNPTYSLARVMLSCWVLTTTAVLLVVYFSSGALPSLDGGVPLLLLASGLTVGSTAVIETILGIGVGKSAWFLEDILADKDGLAIHRLQAVIVNLLLLGVVWQQLITEGTIANVERGWGALMGISAGVYLYGKTTESSA